MTSKAMQAITKALDADAQQLSSSLSSSLQSVQEEPGQLLEGLNQGLNYSLHQVLPGLQESAASTAAGLSAQVRLLLVPQTLVQCLAAVMHGLQGVVTTMQACKALACLLNTSHHLCVIQSTNMIHSIKDSAQQLEPLLCTLLVGYRRPVG